MIVKYPSLLLLDIKASMQGLIQYYYAASLANIPVVINPKQRSRIANIPGLV